MEVEVLRELGLLRTALQPHSRCNLTSMPAWPTPPDQFEQMFAEMGYSRIEVEVQARPAVSVRCDQRWASGLENRSLLAGLLFDRERHGGFEFCKDRTRSFTLAVDSHKDLEEVSS